jgi:hypothetical protein
MRKLKQHEELMSNTKTIDPEEIEIELKEMKEKTAHEIRG